MSRRLLIALTAVAVVSVTPAHAQQVRVLDLGNGIFEGIGVAVGTGGERTVATPASNTFLVTTADGNVVIDTSLATVAASHKQALTEKSRGPVKAISWFDGNPATMYETPPSAAYPELVTLAGGPGAVAARAQALAATDPIRALSLTDMALAADSTHRRTLEVRLAILQALDRQSTNSNERGWLAAGIRDVEARLE
jgi:alkyl sulfatase BDS1-like metallo-beta-lactamase superfamily hydrolase